jgi:hypothetical protein
MMKHEKETHGSCHAIIVSFVLLLVVLLRFVSKTTLALIKSVYG